MCNILITGGAGYIGSILIYKLKINNAKIKITILDNLQNCDNTKHITSKFPDICVKKGEIEDINIIFPDVAFDIIIHLGANAYVGESINKPDKYFGKNVNATYEVAKYAQKTKPKHLLFSSTCAVYGSQNVELTETSRIIPDSPYGYSKIFSENILTDAISQDTCLTIFRFFNIAGAIPEFSGGEHHTVETHLIPILVNKVINNEPISIFGSDYNTKDGTCVREYVHVVDIAEAHILAINNEVSGTFNLGTSNPISNLQVLQEVQKYLQKPAKFQFMDRRVGDAENLYSSYAQARLMLGWEPVNSNMQNIIKTYVSWFKRFGETK